MKAKEVTLFGGTGLIGSSLLEILLKDDRYSKINVVTRRSFLVNNSKVSVHLIDFLDQKAIEQTIENSEIVFASIGTTQAQVKAAEIANEGITLEYDSGNTRTTLEVIQSRSLLLDSRIGNAKAERDLAISKFELLAVIGDLTLDNLKKP